MLFIITFLFCASQNLVPEAPAFFLGIETKGRSIEEIGRALDAPATAARVRVAATQI